MDYFTELLDSFNRLKKRTFKLEYISEVSKLRARADAAAANPQAHAQAQQTAAAEQKERATAAETEASETQGEVDAAAIKAAEDQARDVVKAGVTQVPDASKEGGAEPYAYLATDRQSINLVGGPVGAFAMSVADPGGNEDVNSEGWKKLVSFFQEGDAARAITDAEVAEQQRIERQTIGGFMSQELAEGEELGGLEQATIHALEKQKEEVAKFCKNNESLQNKKTEDGMKLKHFCSRLNSYFAAGNSSMGLEYKLATMKQTAQVGETSEEDEIKEGDPIETTSVEEAGDPALALSIAQNHGVLMSFLNHDVIEGDTRCETLNRSIGAYKKDRIVIFSDDKNADGTPAAQKGLVVTPNQLQNLALDRAYKQCEISREDLQQYVGDGIDYQEKNAILGTFYEAVLVFSTQISANQSLSDTDKKIANKEAADTLLKVIADNHRILTAIQRERFADPEAGEDLLGTWEGEIQEEMLAMIEQAETGERTNLEQWIMREVHTTKALVDFMGAEGVIHAGGTSKTGGRDDVKFVYSNEEVAQEKADAIGSTMIEDPKDSGKFIVGIGLKRMQKLKAKFGEINSQERLTGMITGDITSDGKIEPGFAKSMQDRQFGGPVDGGPGDREKALIDYARDLDQTIIDTTSPLEDEQVWVSNDGQIRSSSPQTVIERVANSLLKVLTFGQIGEGKTLTDAFFTTNEKTETVLKPFTDDDEGESNRARCREAVSRVARFNLLNSDIAGTPRPVKFDETGMTAEEIEAKTKELELELNSPEAIERRQQAAQDYIIKAALICGSNTRDMSQVIVTDDGQTRVVKHNELFDMICKANNSDDPEKRPVYTFEDSSVQITVDGLTLTLGQERTGKGANAQTRTKVDVPKRTLDDPRMLADISEIPTQQNNSNFQDFVQGQIKLLETFLTQTT